MGQMLLDLGCQIVSDETLADATKPVIQVFKKQRKKRMLRKNFTVEESGSFRQPPERGTNVRKNRRLRTVDMASNKKPNKSLKRADRPNPDSPFAVLAELKLKN